MKNLSVPVTCYLRYGMSWDFVIPWHCSVLCRVTTLLRSEQLKKICGIFFYWIYCCWIAISKDLLALPHSCFHYYCTLFCLSERHICASLCFVSLLCVWLVAARIRLDLCLKSNVCPWVIIPLPILTVYVWKPYVYSTWTRQLFLWFPLSSWCVALPHHKRFLNHTPLGLVSPCGHL